MAATGAVGDCFARRLRKPYRASPMAVASLLLLQRAALLLTRGCARTPVAKPAGYEAADKALLLAVLRQAPFRKERPRAAIGRRRYWRPATTCFGATLRRPDHASESLFRARTSIVRRTVRVLECAEPAWPLLASIRLGSKYKPESSKSSRLRSAVEGALCRVGQAAVAVGEDS